MTSSPQLLRARRPLQAPAALQRSRSPRRRRLSFAVALAAICLAAPRAYADPIVLGCRSGNVLQRVIKRATAGGVAEIQLASNCVYVISTPATATDAFETIVDDLTITGGENTVIARKPGAASNFRFFEVAPGARLLLRNLTLAHGKLTGLGGAVETGGTLIGRHVTFTGNTSNNGGAVHVLVGGKATFTDSVFQLNSTTSVGGGGVITSGTLKVVRSLFAHNDAPIDGGAINVQSGGTAKVVDSRLEYNVSGSQGGAISNLGSLTVVRSVIRRNTGGSGGGIATSNASDVLLQSSSINHNKPDNCTPSNAIAGCTD